MRVGYHAGMGRSRVVNLANFEQFTAINVLSDPGAIGGPVKVPQCAQIVLNWTLEDGKTAHNVLYGRFGASFAGTVAQANAILTGLTTGVNWTTLAAFLAPTTALAGISIRNVDIVNQALIQSTGAAAPGTSASPALPNEVAAVITLRTAATGPQNRGRVYVPGFATNALGAGNVIAAAAVTAIQNWGQQLINTINANGYTMVIGQKARAAYKGSTGTDHPARAAGSVVVTGQVVRDNHWDTQRRRGLK